MSTTTVAQRKRSAGWRKPEGSVCVDRTSRWGNPFIIQKTAVGWRVILPGDGLTVGFDTLLAARTFATELFDWWVHASTDGDARWIRDHVHELAGAILLCWCDPADGPCHARPLAEMADSSWELDR